MTIILVNMLLNNYVLRANYHGNDDYTNKTAS